MNWTNVTLIMIREVRDQLRDRRMLFMIFVLPILLYPLLGMSFLQVAQFVREHSTSVLIVGLDELPADQTLTDGDRFREDYFSSPEQARLLRWYAAEDELAPETADDESLDEHALHAARYAAAQQAVLDGKYEVVVLFPPEFGQRLRDFRRTTGEVSVDELPDPEICYNSAKEKSQIAFARVYQVLNRWRDTIAEQRDKKVEHYVKSVLETAGAELPNVADTSFKFAAVDIASPAHRDAAVWSKVFPFLLLLWALTGAFYPAVDLCAGEKERGTLETLLSSPAERSEIVLGKLLTVMAFSMATVVLNIVSMGVTGTFILSQLPQFGPPPVLSLLWLLVALVPVSALFSALCLALAAFAKSTKEGQYYLMPLLLVTMPLVVIPMAPAAELTLGTSLIPVAGIVLVLRSVLEGNHWHALPFVPPVVVVTLVCCLLAIRWAIDQFNSETVLFRESERFQLNLWVRHLLRDREATPSVAEALFCGVLILVIRFFMGFALPQPSTFEQFINVALISQIVVIATPALLMTIMLTSSPRQTLLLRLPPWQTVPAAVLLALALHPVVMWFQVSVVQRLYPVSDDVAGMFQELLAGQGNFWLLLLTIAVVAPLCEEVAYRGFILSGLRHLGHKWRAIVLSSIFFGTAHALFQQSIVASLVGVVIGYLAVQSGSLLPGIVYHMLHNGLALVSTRVTPDVVERYPALGWIFHEVEGSYLFNAPVVVLGALFAAGVLYRLHRLPYAKSDEERLQEAIDHHAAHSLIG